MVCEVDSAKSDESSEVGDFEGKIVVVFINGFLSPHNWISYPEHLIPPHIHMISVYPSPTGSFHDRVCEIFYELKGGTVDYGQEHSDFHGHHRYGKHFLKGKYPQWSAKNPIVVIGHSLGGMTGWIFQNYLAEQRFPGHDTDASWIKSMIGVNAPYNGTLKVYETGIRLNQPPIFHWASPGYWISFMVHLGESFNFRPWLDLDQRHWMVWLGSPHSILLCILMICGYGMHSATDNTAYDTTIHSNLVWNHALNNFPNTYYFNIVGKVNQIVHDEEDHRAEKVDTTTWPYVILRLIMKYFHIPAPQYIAGVLTEHWLRKGTDGVVCTYAQEFPRVANRHNSELISRLKGKVDIERGIWYYTHRNISHICTSFMCGKTWSYILHVVEDLEQRYQEQKCRDLERLDEIKQCSKNHEEYQQKLQDLERNRVKSNSSHLLSQYKPDMQDVNLKLQDCHDCSMSVLQQSVILTGIRVVSTICLCAVLFWQLIGSNMGLMPAIPSLMSLPFLLLFRMCNGFRLKTKIFPVLLWEFCFVCIRFVLLICAWNDNNISNKLLTQLRWTWLIEGLLNASFAMDVSSVVMPALKLLTGVATLNISQLVPFETVIVSLLGQQLLMGFPPALWLYLNYFPVEDVGDRRYSIRMGYIMGSIFVVMCTFIGFCIVPISARISLSVALGENVPRSVVLWIALQMVIGFVKFSDFSHFVTFVLIKLRFLHYRNVEWKESKGSKNYVSRKMLSYKK